MADIIIALNPGYVWNETDPLETLTFAKLNKMLQDGSANIISGQIPTGTIADNAITTAKLNTTLSFAGITVTHNLITADTDEQLRAAANTAPTSIGQLALASDTGNIYIAKGLTNADWVLAAIVTVQEITQVANYKGQLSYSGTTPNDAIYMAKDKSVVGDWTKTLPINSLEFENNAGDPAGLASKTTVWDNAAELYYRRGTGTVQNLTMLNSQLVKDPATPDYDTGWVAIANNTEYDLTTFGSVDITAVSGLTSSDDSCGFRTMQSMFRISAAGTERSYLVYNTWSVDFSNVAGWYVYWDADGDQFWLQTKTTWLFDSSVKAATTLAGAIPNWNTSGALTFNAGDLRLKGWI